MPAAAVATLCDARPGHPLELPGLSVFACSSCVFALPAQPCLLDTPCTWSACASM